MKGRQRMLTKIGRRRKKISAISERGHIRVSHIRAHHIRAISEWALAWWDRANITAACHTRGSWMSPCWQWRLQWRMLSVYETYAVVSWPVKALKDSAHADLACQITGTRTATSQATQVVTMTSITAWCTSQLVPLVLLWTPSHHIGLSEKLLSYFPGPCCITRLVTPLTCKIAPLKPLPLTSVQHLNLYMYHIWSPTATGTPLTQACFLSGTVPVLSPPEVMPRVLYLQQLNDRAELSQLQLWPTLRPWCVPLHLWVQSQQLPRRGRGGHSEVF